MSGDFDCCTQPPAPVVPGGTGQTEARAVCEHFYATHCYRGLSIRLCMMCHQPDWDDLERLMCGAVAAPAATGSDGSDPEPVASPGQAEPRTGAIPSLPVAAVLDPAALRERIASVLDPDSPVGTVIDALIAGVTGPLLERAGRAEFQLAAIAARCDDRSIPLVREILAILGEPVKDGSEEERREH